MISEHFLHFVQRFSGISRFLIGAADIFGFLKTAIVVPANAHPVVWPVSGQTLAQRGKVSPEERNSEKWTNRTNAFGSRTICRFHQGFSGLISPLNSVTTG